MPSAKGIHIATCAATGPPAPRPKSRRGAVVSFPQWCEQNEDHLLDLYEMLQAACHTTGRYVFDAETCSFGAFCEVAYRNSHKYARHDPNYRAEDGAEDGVEA